jgi:YjbE family integral membrane protein
MLDAHFLGQELIALGQVIMIDLVLAGDNAVVVGMAAAGLPREMRGKVILLGIMAATILRILFALIANRLLVVVGLTLAGGILLLWVCWKFWRELDEERRRRRFLNNEQEEMGDSAAQAESPGMPTIVPKTMRQAIFQIVVADVSMSIDNVLAVAGAAARHTGVMVIGLVLSVGLMGIAASFIAAFLKKHHWVAYVGLAIILWVALDMIYRGSNQVIDEMAAVHTAHGAVEIQQSNVRGIDRVAEQ